MSEQQPMKLVEAYLVFPWMGPRELAEVTGMTMAEVAEGLYRRGLPMGPIFERQMRLAQQARDEEEAA